MYEHIRQQYLEAMGIQTYMPKWILPSALLPIQCDLTVLASAASVEQAPRLAEAAPQVVVPEVYAESVISQPLTSKANSVLSAMLADGKSSEVNKPTTKLANLSLLAKQQIAQAQVQAFSLSLWQCAGLIVIADRQIDKALPVNVLLKNILIALGYARVDTQKPEVIKWPLEGLTSAQAGPAEDYLKSILLARRLVGQLTTLLCFGEQACAHLLEKDLSTYSKTVISLSGGEDMPAFALPSLDSLIESPSLKAPVWAAISPLRMS